MNVIGAFFLFFLKYNPSVWALMFCVQNKNIAIVKG